MYLWFDSANDEWSRQTGSLTSLAGIRMPVISPASLSNWIRLSRRVSLAVLRGSKWIVSVAKLGSPRTPASFASESPFRRRWTQAVFLKSGICSPYSTMMLVSPPWRYVTLGWLPDADVRCRIDDAGALATSRYGEGIVQAPPFTYAAVACKYASFLLESCQASS